MAALKMRTQAQEMQLQHRTAHDYERDTEIAVIPMTMRVRRSAPEKSGTKVCVCRKGE